MYNEGDTVGVEHHGTFYIGNIRRIYKTETYTMVQFSELFNITKNKEDNLDVNINDVIPLDEMLERAEYTFKIRQQMISKNLQHWFKEEDANGKFLERICDIRKRINES